MLGLLDAEAADDALPRVEQTERRADEVTTKGLATDDVLEFIDNEESRELCRQVIECKGNMSAAARRLGVSEGTIRYRLKLLAPKLIAAGFNPFGMEEIR
jgi:transcriptional regulator of acetoin/glycerol metabolism